MKLQTHDLSFFLGKNFFGGDSFFSLLRKDSYDSLHIEKALTLYNVIIHIKSKDQNHYDYNMFLEKVCIS